MNWGRGVHGCVGSCLRRNDGEGRGYDGGGCGQLAVCVDTAYEPSAHSRRRKGTWNSQSEARPTIEIGISTSACSVAA